jgi:hypothetical protein
MINRDALKAKLLIVTWDVERLVEVAGISAGKCHRGITRYRAYAHNLDLW